MIKFFRHIRQNLIMENPPNGKSRASKTGNPAFAKASAGRYLKYAIGEIVLCPVRDNTRVGIKIGSYPCAVRYRILYNVPKGTKN